MKNLLWEIKFWAIFAVALFIDILLDILPWILFITCVLGMVFLISSADTKDNGIWMEEKIIVDPEILEKRLQIEEEIDGQQK